MRSLITDNIVAGSVRYSRSHSLSLDLHLNSDDFRGSILRIPQGNYSESRSHQSDSQTGKDKDNKCRCGIDFRKEQMLTARLGTNEYIDPSHSLVSIVIEAHCGME